MYFGLAVIWVVGLWERSSFVECELEYADSILWCVQEGGRSIVPRDWKLSQGLGVFTGVVGFRRNQRGAGRAFAVLWAHGLGAAVTSVVPVAPTAEARRLEFMVALIWYYVFVILIFGVQARTFYTQVPRAKYVSPGSGGTVLFLACSNHTPPCNRLDSRHPVAKYNIKYVRHLKYGQPYQP